MQNPEKRPVVDAVMTERLAISAGAATRTKVLDRLRLGDAMFRHLTRTAAIGVLLLLSGVISRWSRVRFRRSGRSASAS